MIDKALFLGSNGASQSMHELQLITNNLANINTTGFRGDYEMTKQVDLGNKSPTRTYSVSDKSYSDFNPGPIVKTDRDLDIAISGKGFIAVQSKTGAEAYTRAGDLQINAQGFLTTRNGDLVKGQNGFIQMGQQVGRVSIGTDGTVSVRNVGETDYNIINQIKLTNPQLSQLQKGADGMFYLPEGNVAKIDNSVILAAGSLEGSNVNAVETLTKLIELSRNFEQHSNMMKMMMDQATESNHILEMPR